MRVTPSERKTPKLMVIGYTYRQAHAKQQSQLKCSQKTVHHVYLITPDGLWMMQADIGLRASAVQIRLALTLDVEEACKPGPCFISPGCITHF